MYDPRRWLPVRLLALTVLVGCQSEADPPSQPSTPPPQTQAPPAAQPAQPQKAKERSVVEVSIKDLPSTFSVDEAEAFAQDHREHDLVVTGYVEGFGVGWHPDTATYVPSVPTVTLVALDNDDLKYSNLNLDLSHLVNCYTPGILPWEKLGIGAEVKLRGRYATHRGFKYMEDCKVELAAGTPPPRYSAHDLCVALRNDEDEVKKQIGALGTVVIAGTVKELHRNDKGDIWPVLAGAEGLDVYLTYTSNNELQFKELKTGDELSVIGHAIILDLDDDMAITINMSARFDQLNIPTKD